MEGATQRVASAFLTWMETNLAFRFEASMDMLFKSLARWLVMLGRIFALRSSGAQGGCDYFGVQVGCKSMGAGRIHFGNGSGAPGLRTFP